jgi:hypothetical protein
MYRYHRILYRRLLRGQSDDELLQLRDESAGFPTLAELIDDELERRMRPEPIPAESVLDLLRGAPRGTATPLA